MLPCNQNEETESQTAYGILLVFITILAPVVAFYAVIEENKDDILLLAPSSDVMDWVVRKCGTCWDGTRQVISVLKDWVVRIFGTCLDGAQQVISVLKDWVVRICGTCLDSARPVIAVLRGLPSRNAVLPVEEDQEK
jgi:hypothetical protein